MVLLMPRRPRGRRRFPVTLVLPALLMAGSAQAMTFTTTAELRHACETSPGNIVVLTDSTKIQDGIRPPATEQVATGCTLVLGANFEAERVSMTFAGPLVVQSANKAEVKLTESLLAATAVTLNLPAASSVYQSTLSGVHARTGNLSITLGPEALLIVLERDLRGSEHALAAAGTVQLQGGRKLTGLLAEMAIRAPLGLQISMAGAEGLLKLEEVEVQAPQGSVSITATGTKSLVLLDKVSLRFADRWAVRLTGEESALSLKQVSAGGDGGNLAVGGIRLEVGTGTAGNGKLEATEVRFFDLAALTVRVSPGGPKGGLKVEKSQLSALGDIRFETGPQGTTEVKENNGGSETRFRVSAGPGGNCVAEQNNFFAAVLELCP